MQYQDKVALLEEILNKMHMDLLKEKKEHYITKISKSVTRHRVWEDVFRIKELERSNKCNK